MPSQLLPDEAQARPSRCSPLILNFPFFFYHFTYTPSPWIVHTTNNCVPHTSTPSPLNTPMTYTLTGVTLILKGDRLRILLYSFSLLAISHIMQWGRKTKGIYPSYEMKNTKKERVYIRPLNFMADITSNSIMNWANNSAYLYNYLLDIAFRLCIAE